jgi:hypothetical protein
MHNGLASRFRKLAAKPKRLTKRRLASGDRIDTSGILESSRVDYRCRSPPALKIAATVWHDSNRRLASDLDWHRTAGERSGALAAENQDL